MPRCCICDYCDTAESVSNILGRGPLRWSPTDKGFICDTCSYDYENEEELESDDIWESDYQTGGLV